MFYRKPGLLPLILFSLSLLSGCATYTSPDHTAASATKGPDDVLTGGAAGRSEADPAAPTAAGRHRTFGRAAYGNDPRHASDRSRPDNDIWARIRGGFRLDPVENEQVQSELEWYASHPEYLARVQDRARPFLHFILEQTEQRAMPTELVLLPVVESAFQVFAYSPGRASGLWQFIPSTADWVGLKRTWWYDGRRDVVASTTAALDYLQQLNQSLEGDWELTLAAYNAGVGTVKRAVRQNRAAGKPTDYWSLSLPGETRKYVPRLLAITRIVANPAAYNVQLEPIPNAPYFDTVELNEQIDLALAADMAGLTIDELYRLNPGFNRWATDPAGPHRLQLPRDRVAAFTQELDKLDPRQRMRWTRYTIRPGDTLGGIAKKHEVTIDVLKQANKLRSSRIRAGRHLLIPAASREATHYALAAEQHLSGRTDASAATNGRLTYEVLPGDSLWTIARQHGVDHDRLAQWNGITTDDILHPGQDLVILRPARESKLSSKTLARVGHGMPAIPRGRIKYRVRKGDSLSRIAHRFGVTVSDLRRWNHLPGKYLQPGQKLTLYVEAADQATL